MTLHFTRRQFAAFISSGLIGFSGCQSVANPEVSVTVHLFNLTEKVQETYLELTKPGEPDFQIGRINSIDVGEALEVNVSVRPGTYQLLLDIDDTDPRVRQTAEWKITEDECTAEKYWVIENSGDGVTIQLGQQSC
jgi:hypothetical protein